MALPLALLLPEVLKAGEGLVSMIEGGNALDKIPQRKSFKTGQQIYSEGQNVEGFSQAERNLYYRRMLLSNAQAFHRAKEVSGSLAGTLQGAIAGNDLSGEVSLAAQDNVVKRQNALRLMNLIQQQDNAEVNSFNNDVTRQEQAYGQAVQSGKQNLFSALNNTTNLFGTDYLMKNYGTGASSSSITPTLDYKNLYNPNKKKSLLYDNLLNSLPEDIG